MQDLYKKYSLYYLLKRRTAEFLVVASKRQETPQFFFFTDYNTFSKMAIRLAFTILILHNYI